MTVRVRPAYLGIDVGTSACKAVALSEAGQVLATATQAYATRHGSDGESTQDADDWLRAVRVTARTCVDALRGRPVGAIGVTGPAHYAVLVGAEGRPLSRVLLTTDGRPERTVAELRARMGAAFAELTYEQLTGSWTFPQLVWLHRTFPDLWPRIRLVLVVKDYVRYRLTERATTDPTDAAGTGLYDQRARTWSPVLLEEAHLSPDQLPQIRGPFEVGGTLSRAWARAIGVASGIPVAVGATDTAAELVSVDAVSEGDAIVKIASTGTVVVVGRQPRPHPALLTYPHVLPGRWYTAAVTNSAATTVTWLGRILNGGTRAPAESYRDVGRAASRVPLGSRGVIFLPFLAGERTPYWDRDLRAAFVGLTASHGRDELCRAVMEGVAFSLRACCDLIRENGMRIERPYLVGGGSSSPLWRSIVTAALRIDGRLAEPNGPAVGAALIARAAPSGTATLPRARPRLRSVPPRDGWALAYDKVYAHYQSAVGTLAGLSHELAEAAQPSSEASGR